MPTMILTWMTAADDLVCPLCRPLHGHVWRLKAGTDKLPNTLLHLGRAVWDVATHTSMAHGGSSKHCRCTLHVDTDTQDVLDFAEALTEAIK